MRTDQALAAGTKLRGGHYKVTGTLGAGGFGIVYRAATRRGKSVAIKELFPDKARRQSVLGLWTRKAVKPTPGWADLERQARDEFRTVRTLKHRNIVRVIELFGENGTLYLVMELLDGETLHDRLCHKPDGLSEDEAVRIAASLADALAYAHSKGVLHRDVKPGNVMLTKAGRPVLVDFGLARAVKAHAAHCQSGTDAYMAPEQAEGRAQTWATDVYSLAATVYHMLTGCPPASAVDRVRADHLVPPAAEHPGVSETVSAAVTRALALDPAERTPTARAFLAELGVVQQFTLVPRPANEGRWAWTRGLLIVAGLALAAGVWQGCPAPRPVPALSR